MTTWKRRLKNTPTLIGAALIVGGALLFAGCNGDDDDNKGGGQPQPTATPTTASGQNPTPTPTVMTGGNPTATPTTGSGAVLQGEAAAKAVAGIAQGFSELADIGAGFAGGSGSGAGLIPPVDCPNGGTVEISCTPAGANSQVGLDMDGCQVVAPGLSEFVGTGTIDLVLPLSDFCFSFQAPPGTQIDATFNGLFEFSDLTLGLFTSTTFDDFQVQIAVDAADTATLTMDGAADVNCVGPIVIQTTEEIVVPLDSCPIAGAIAVDLDDGTVVEITYGTDPAVSVDYEGSVTNYNDCEDPELNACGQS